MRIEFWGYPDPDIYGYPEDRDPGKPAAWAYREDACLAPPGLHGGDLVSTDFIADFGSSSPPGSPEAACRAHLLTAIPVPFMMVDHTENYVAVTGPGGTAAGLPAVRLVFRRPVPASQEARDALTVAFTAMGWTVHGLAGEEEAAARVYGLQPGR